MTTPKAPPSHFTILYFASATSYTQRQHDFLSAPMLIGELPKALESKYPGITAKVLDSSALTVNLEYVDFEEEAAKGEAALVIREGDEVGIIPPVSSG